MINRLRPLLPYLLLVMYTGLVLATLSIRPLWVDELNQMLGRVGGWQGVLTWAKIGPGGTPLAYLMQHGLLNALGFSTFTVRLLAALFGIGAVVLFYLLSKRSLPATILFAFLPIVFRYAQEGRPYSQGLFFVVLALYAYPQPLPILLGLACLLGLYSQTLVLFPVVALLGVSLYRRQWLHAMAIAIAIAAFLPWFFAARQTAADAQTMSQFFFSWKQVAPLALVHDFTGGGYWTTVLLIGLAAYGWTRPANDRLLTTAVFVASFFGPIFADAASGYFFAERQLLFSIPILVLWAAYALMDSKPEWLGVAALLLVASLSKNARYPRAASENWAHAARTLQEQLQIGNGCVLVAPPKSLEYFAMFEPGLKARQCPDTPSTPVILSVVTPYSTPAQIAASTKIITSATAGHYQPDTTFASGGMLVRKYVKTN